MTDTGEQGRTDEQGRAEPPLAGDEMSTLVGFLDYHRGTLAWKTAGLDAAGLAATTGATDMTLGGILKHLALVEDDWFGCCLLGRPPAAVWAGVDWDADRDWDWHSAAEDSPEELRALWTATVDQSRRDLAAAAANGGLDQLAARAWDDGRAPSLRWILVHLIEEYARHNGHADLLRQAVDGQTGE
ncbi:DinB family protein [Microlunatus aurantiacus]|uniref:DinB family protein n=1 Tax=Microlunatus aurantiacus TaxID=446786 RepID=A0ABP7CQ89_9ACTN